MQVVTSENFQQLIETGKVPDYVPPKSDAKVEVSVEKAESEAKETPPRGEDGKFVKADDVAADAAMKAVKPAGDDEGDDPDGEGLTEHARRVIGKKHRRMKDAEEFARQLYGDKTAAEKRAEEAERKLAERDTKSRPDSDKDSKEPKAEDFKTVGEYAEALAEYKVEKKFAERDAKREQEAREQAMQAAQREHFKRVETAAKEIPDYAEVVDNADFEVPPHMAVYIAESPLGPKLGYHLAKHTDEFDRISKLSPIRAIAELGKLEDRLEKPKAEEKKPEAETRVSRAPSPTTPLDSRSASVTKDPSKMTIPELREYERAQRLAKARR